MTHGTALAVLKDGRHLNLSTQQYATFEDFAACVRVLFGPVRFQVEAFYWAFGAEHQCYTPGDMREAFKME